VKKNPLEEHFIVNFTVKITICPVTVPLPLHRDRPSVTVTWPSLTVLPIFTDRYSPLLTVTDFKKILNFLRNIFFLIKML
jgi:hypothetical protein